MQNFFNSASETVKPSAFIGRQTGLSLVEVLVTMSIIGVATSLIVLTTFPVDRATAEADKLRNILERTAETSRMTGHLYGLIIEDETSYSIVSWQAGEWKTAPYGKYNLPNGTTLEKDKSPSPSRSEESINPDIIFDPLGHTTRAKLTLSSEKTATHFYIQNNGSIEIGQTP